MTIIIYIHSINHELHVKNISKEEISVQQSTLRILLKKKCYLIILLMVVFWQVAGKKKPIRNNERNNERIYYPEGYELSSFRCASWEQGGVSSSEKMKYLEEKFSIVDGNKMLDLVHMSDHYSTVQHFSLQMTFQFTIDQLN